jgi:Right handed beta helix region/RTX calcium-binding nonapeptide repeat (4 copies)
MGFRGLRGIRGVCTSAIAAGALLLAVPAIASADTFTVNDDDVATDVGPGGTCGPRDFDSINDALAIAVDEDVIRVCAGTYDESISTGVVDDLSILGAQAGVDARNRSVPVTDESVVTSADTAGTIQVDGGGNVVDGFTVADNPDGPGIGVDALEPTIVNNIVANNDGGLFGDGLAITIRRNHFNANTVDSGVEVLLGFAEFAEVDDNLFEGGAGASFVAGFEGLAGGQITITDNESNGTGGIGVLGGTDVEIARNTITDPPFDEFGGIIVGTSSDVDVTRNTVVNPPFLTPAIGVFNFDGPSEFVDITRNTLVGDGDEAGILVDEEAHEGPIDVHFNRIAGNEVGLFVSDFHFVDAENNWWGCNEGPEDADCDPISFDIAEVLFDPWLTLSAAADPESISAGGATSQVMADLLTNSDGETMVGDFPDGTQIDFATDLGTVDPPFDLTQGAVAQTTLTSGEETGTANVDSTLDNETVTTEVEITEESLPPACTERIDGTAQNDNLTGTDGSELIRGRGGRDKVNGLAGDDCVKGGAGPDKVIGGPDEDRIRGGAGDDKVKARDGESDVVRCGAGDDIAKVNPGDEVKGCEEVKRG